MRSIHEGITYNVPDEQVIYEESDFIVSCTGALFGKNSDHGSVPPNLKSTLCERGSQNANP